MHQYNAARKIEKHNRFSNLNKEMFSDLRNELYKFMWLCDSTHSSESELSILNLSNFSWSGTVALQFVSKMQLLAASPKNNKRKKEKQKVHNSFVK